MKQQHIATPRLNALAAAVATCFTVNAHALPTAPTVTSGTASFQQTTNSLTVTNSTGAIIQWNSFSIGAGEATRFIQPSASSSVLNRVLGGDPSQIYGSLSSNGRIYLVNPAGIFVGPGGTVNAAAFIASTLAISDSDFLAGRLIFSSGGSAGTVENQGVITTPEGGSVYLIGSQVINTGTIDAPNGEVLLAAGQSVQLVNTGTPGVTVEFSASDGASELVQNFGTIAATGGQIGLASALVKNSGTLNASSVSREGGRIFLRASKQVEVDAAGRIVVNGTSGGSVQLKSDDTTLVSGDIEATGSSGSGGRVEVLGNKVGVFDGASVNASGSTGGGTILVGGDLQGINADVQNAQVTWFGRDASLTADAVEAGDGGKIIVWADDTTRAYGQISARGGADGGDGGFVEASGKRVLEFDSRVDLGASQGAAGTLLLDPMDVTILYSATDNPAAFSGDGVWFEPANSASSTTLYWLDGTGPGSTGIQDLLNAGTNVTITTAGSYGGPFLGGTISFAYGGGTPFSWTSGATLKLLATNNIAINYGVTASTGTLDMVASWDGNLANPSVLPGTGSITESADGYLLVNRVRASAGGNVTLTSSENQVADLSAFSSGGSITYNGGATAGSNDIYLRDLRAPNGSVTVNTNNTFGGNVTLGYLEASTGIGGSINVTAAKAILEDDVGTTDIVAYGASLSSAYGAASAATLAISADFDVNSSMNATVGVTASYGGIRLANTGSSSFDSPGNNLSTTDSSVYGGNTTYSGKGFVDIGSTHFFSNSSAVGSLSVSTPNDIYVTNTPNTWQNVIFNAGLNIETGVIGSIVASNVVSLTAGVEVWIDQFGTVSGAQGVAISAPTVLIDGAVTSSQGAITVAANSVTVNGSYGGSGIVGEKGVAVTGNSGISLVNGGTISTGSNSSFNGDIALITAGSVTLDGGSGISNAKFGSPATNVAISAGGNLELTNGSYIESGDDIFIELTGGTSSVILSGPNPSYILSDSVTTLPATTYINFFGRASGGVFIDGVQTTTSVAGGSGFFNVNTSTPADLGAGLKITYASGVDPVSKEIGSIFDDDTRDTEDINEFETDEVKERADEFAEENSDESSGRSKPSQCT